MCAEAPFLPSTRSSFRRRTLCWTVRRHGRLQRFPSVEVDGYVGQVGGGFEIVDSMGHGMLGGSALAD